MTLLGSSWAMALDSKCRMQNAKCKMQKLCACDRDLFPFCILHFAFCIRIERYDHERLVILRRAVASESANGIQQRLLDLLGGQVTGVQQHALEALEAERLAVVVYRFDSA